MPVKLLIVQGALFLALIFALDAAYQKVLESNHETTKFLFENYCAWGRPFVK